MPNTREIRNELVQIVKKSLLPNIGTSAQQTLRFVDNLIASGVTIQKWIPVTERLPEENTGVLTYRESGINNAKPQTNADSIRLMSDEELANFMTERNVNESTLLLLDEGHTLTATQIEALKHRIYCACMRWLKQPVKD